MDTLKAKYTEWKSVYFDKFFSSTNVPAESVCANGLVMGDGTINIAHLLQYLHVCNLNGEENSITIRNCLEKLDALEDAAHDYFATAFPIMDEDTSAGFFLRDDATDAYTGALKSLTDLTTEDPCFSPFTSQDQVWNLNPALMLIATSDLYDDETKEIAALTGFANNYFIQFHGYKVINPYLSWIKHHFTYCPDFDLSLSERVSDRSENIKYDVKVKRGANNWYYSGGTKSCVDAFGSHSKAFSGTFRTFLYKCTIFVLDKLYEPLLGLFGSSFKHNSYNCYAATSGIWYNDNLAKSRAKKTNKWLKKKGDFYNWNTDFIVGDSDTINWDLVKQWLDDYAEYDSTATTIESPIKFLCVYQWYMHHLNDTTENDA